MKKTQRALLAGININNEYNMTQSMEELFNLAQAGDYEVVGTVEQNVKAVNSAYYMGTGKVEEAAELVKQSNAEVIIFDNELSPSQLRNLEKALECRILDRTALILEIFARRAKTKEAKLQVEVARLQYMLPKLIGSNENLGRQASGVGVRNKGVGEKKLELDRRKTEDKISELSKELELLARDREVQRKRRAEAHLPKVALVGYTNAGKSTLMNALVDFTHKGDEKKVLEKDMLFATLETSVRNITLKDNRAFLLSDTVGFVSKLPHNLVKAFRSTLEEVRTADLLLMIIDASNPDFEQQIKVTEETLKEIGADGIPAIYVYNKADLTTLTLPIVDGEKIYISAKRMIGLEQLIELIGKRIFTDYVKCTMLIPYQRGELVSYFNDNAQVKSMKFLSEGTLLTLECTMLDYKRYEQFAYVL